MRPRLLLVTVILIGATCWAQNASTFPALQLWKTGIVNGDASGLKSLYSVSPPARISTLSGKIGADEDVAFWTGLKAKSISMHVVESGSPRPGIESFTLQLTIQRSDGPVVNMVEAQAWQDQDGTWRLVGAQRDIAKMPQPASVSNSIYPQGDAHEELLTALTQARQGHKNVLLVFGADWCYDCHVLDKAFHRPDVAAVLNPNYEVVHIDIGEENENLDLAKEYQVPLDRGIPAIAVLNSDGKLLYSQKNGEWERARALGVSDLLVLLNRWKPSRA